MAKVKTIEEMESIENQAKVFADDWKRNGGIAVNIHEPRVIRKQESKSDSIDQILTLIDVDTTKPFSQQTNDLNQGLRSLENVLFEMRSIRSKTYSKSHGSQESTLLWV
jgi:hypothetical protein